MALGLAGEAGAGLTWVDFNLVMSQQTLIRWALNSWAAQANHGHPNLGELKKVVLDTKRPPHKIRRLEKFEIKGGACNYFELNLF